MSDNAHNYFLEFLATGGYPLAMIYISLTLLTILSIYSIQRKIGKFDFELSSLYSAWFVFQLQSFISPSNISLIVWNALISGYLIGYDLKKIENKNGSSASGKKLLIIPNLASKTLLVLGLIIMFPLYNSDKNIKSGFNKSDLSLVMKSLTAYPESSIRYNVFTQEIIKLNLLPQALELSRAAVRFNPNAVSAWALIFVNPQAPLEERLKAKSEILRLDPLNQEIFKYELK
jgi:hypothetical protein